MRISDWSSDVCSSDLSFVRPSGRGQRGPCWRRRQGDGGFHRHRRSSSGLCKRLRSEEHTSELQSLMRISYAVFCLKKKKHHIEITHHHPTQHAIQSITNIYNPLNEHKRVIML